jgi:xanthine dehydrogenase YagS FAD-binding subunit
MHRFELRAATAAGALQPARPEGGGIDLLDHLKGTWSAGSPSTSRRSGDERHRRQAGGSLRIGPLATMAQVAAHAASSHRALAQACGEAASPQIRNVATIGGNDARARAAGTTGSSRTGA